MKRIALPLIAALTLATPALAAGGDMSVATFLAKADALKAKGAMALFSDDFKLLQKEGQAAGLAYRSRLAGEKAAGKPSSCPPAKASVNSDQLLNYLRGYPEAKRGAITMKTAMAEYFIKTWPCR